MTLHTQQRKALCWRQWDWASNKQPQVCLDLVYQMYDDEFKQGGKVMEGGS